MPRLTEEAAARIKAQNMERDKPSSLGEIGSDALRYLRRAERTAGLAVGQAAAGLTTGFMPWLHFVPGAKDWLPDIERTPQAAKAFWEQARQGDWDAGIEAYQDELDAGPGYWGASEALPTALLPTGVPYQVGKGLLRAAPKLAETVARVAPAAARSGVTSGLRGGVEFTGKALKKPWQVEEAAGQKALAGLGWLVGKTVSGASPSIKRVIDSLRRSGGQEVDPDTFDEAMKALPSGPEPKQQLALPAGPSERLMLPPGPTQLALPAPTKAGFMQAIGAREGDLIRTFATPENPAGITMIIPDNKTTRAILDSLEKNPSIAVIEGRDPQQAMEAWMRLNRPEAAGARGGLTEAMQDISRVQKEIDALAASPEYQAAVRKGPGKRQPPPAAPTTPADIGTARTGSPFTGTFFRGSGRETAEEAYGTQAYVKEAILGKGTYTSPSREYASVFGPNVDEVPITLNNPLVIRSDSEWAALTKKAGWFSHVPTSSADIGRMRGVIERAGHDGVIIQVPKTEQRGRRLQQLFDADTVGSFAEPPPTAAPVLVTGAKVTGAQKQLDDMGRLEAEREALQARIAEGRGSVRALPEQFQAELDPESLLEGYPLGSAQRPLAGEEVPLEEMFRRSPRARALTEEERLLEEFPEIVPRPTDPMVGPIPKTRAMVDAERAAAARDIPPRREPDWRFYEGEEPPIGAGPGTGRAVPEPTPEPSLSQVQDIDEAIEANIRQNFGRKVANAPGIRNILKRVNPNAIRNTIEGRGMAAWHIIRAEGGRKADNIMSELGAIGGQERIFGKVDNVGLFTEGKLKGLAPNDVRTNWEKPAYRIRLNDEQVAWIKKAQELEEMKLAFLKANGININKLAFDKGGHYAGRRVVGKFDREGNLLEFKFVGAMPKRRATKQPFEKERDFITQKQAIDQGYQYLPEDEALALNIKAAYNRVSDKKLAEWLRANSPNLRTLKSATDIKAGETAITEIPGMSGVVFTKDAADIARTMREELNPNLRAIPGMETIGKINAAGRFMTLNADASPFLIQMLYMTGAKGGMRAWGNAWRGFAKAFFDPRYQEKLLSEHRPLLDRHRGLLTSRSGTEMSEAAQKGGLFFSGPLSPIGKGLQLSRFARAFNTAMDEAGIQLAKSLDAHLKPKNAKEMADIDAFINEIRGLADSVRLGVSPNMRLLENNLLLAPRYNRAIASLLWDTVADGGIRGKQARLALGRSISGLFLIGTAFTMAKYARDAENRGEEHTFEGYYKEFQDRMLPNSPHFFTWEIGDTNVGPGTKIRSLVSLFAKSGKLIKEGDTRSLLELSNENPFTRFARGNAAPVASDAWDIFSGHNYMGDPTGFFDGWTEESVGDDLKKLGRNVLLEDIMPIWTQATLLEGGTPQEKATRAAAEFFGGRAYPLGWKDQREKMAREEGYGDYEELNADIKVLVDKLAEERYGEKEYTTAKGPLYKERDDITENFLGSLQSVTDKWLSAPPESPQWDPENARKGPKGYNDLREERIERLYGHWDKKKQRRTGGFYDKLYDMDEEREIPDKETKGYRVWQYYQMFEESVNPDTGEIDWDKHEEIEAKFWASLGDDEIDELMANIRTIEGEYPEPIKRMVSAGRYAGSFKMDILGNQMSYYELETHPSVVQSVANTATIDLGRRVSEADVDNYLDLSYLEREPMAEKDVVGGAISKALNKASMENGVLWSLRKKFVGEAPDEWILAMLDAGYEYQGHREIEKIIFKNLKDGSSMPAFRNKYEELYRANIKKIA